MTVIPPETYRSRRPVATHAYTLPVVRELPSLPQAAQTLDPAW